jgi:hypothetical protein
VERNAIQQPKHYIEEQVLQVVCSLALDFSIGAEKFIKGCAKKMKRPVQVCKRCRSEGRGGLIDN